MLKALEPLTEFTCDQTDGALSRFYSRGAFEGEVGVEVETRSLNFIR